MDHNELVEQYKQENEKLRTKIVRFNDMLASYQNVLVPELRKQITQVKKERDHLSCENWKMKYRIMPAKSGTITALQERVMKLVAELKLLKQELDLVRQERNAAVEQLHGICSACDNYTPNHNEGPCRFCCYETARDPKAEANDNWRWNGGR